MLNPNLPSEESIEEEAKNLLAIPDGVPTLDFAVKAPWTVFYLRPQEFFSWKIKRFVFCCLTIEGIQAGEFFFPWPDLKSVKIEQNGPISIGTRQRKEILYLEGSHCYRSDKNMHAKQFVKKDMDRKTIAFFVPDCANFSSDSIPVMSAVFKKARQLAD